MKLRHDPFQVFRSSQTPAGLYARQNWLDEADMPAWQTDFKDCVTTLLDGQLANGSWQQSAMTTISRLFGLHLTLRSASDRIEDALNWLLRNVQDSLNGIDSRSGTDLEGADLTGLPFVLSHPPLFLTGATLFLCSIFNCQHDPAVMAVYQRLHSDGLIKKRLAKDTASMHNIFRALVVHPDFARESLTAEVVAMYADLQNEVGEWGNRLPLFQTVNALAHLNLPDAEAQLERAFPRLLETQHDDGTWGRRDPEWNTFLCIHALKKKGLL